MWRGRATVIGLGFHISLIAFEYRSLPALGPQTAGQGTERAWLEVNEPKPTVRAYDAKNHRYVGNPTLRGALAFLISEPISRAFLSIPNVIVRQRELIRNSQMQSPSEAVMDGSRNERARARARYLLAQIAPLPDDAEVQRLRGLSMDYIREAERLERERVTTREPSEEISAALDEVARDYFARAVQSKAKE